jgi:hypothetical protein
MDFKLRDQFGKTLQYLFPKERVSVLTSGDRKGSSQIEGWVRPVYERYRDRVDLHGVAGRRVVREVPPKRDQRRRPRLETPGLPSLRWPPLSGRAALPKLSLSP